jgi:hypothetical protein
MGVRDGAKGSAMTGTKLTKAGASGAPSWLSRWMWHIVGGVCVVLILAALGIGAALQSQFQKDVLANFVADVCAGVLLGSVAAFVVGKKLHLLGLAQEQKQRKQQQTLRAIRYLRLLQVKEVGLLVPKISGWREGIRDWYQEEHQIQTPLWFGVLKQGGELAAIVNPTLLSALATFYQGLVYAKRGVNFLLENRQAQARGDFYAGARRGLGPWEEKFEGMVDEGLAQADRTGQGLLDDVADEIERLKGELRKTGLPDSEIRQLEKELELMAAPEQ